MWDLDFISENDFKKHVCQTIENYRESLKSMTLKDFNKNIIDPFSAMSRFTNLFPCVKKKNGGDINEAWRT